MYEEQFFFFEITIFLSFFDLWNIKRKENLSMKIDEVIPSQILHEGIYLHET